MFVNIKTSAEDDGSLSRTVFFFFLFLKSGNRDRMDLYLYPVSFYLPYYHFSKLYVYTNTTPLPLLHDRPVTDSRTVFAQTAGCKMYKLKINTYSISLSLVVNENPKSPTLFFSITPHLRKIMIEFVSPLFCTCFSLQKTKNYKI